jgi:hypothetical protein
VNFLNINDKFPAISLKFLGRLCPNIIIIQVKCPKEAIYILIIHQIETGNFGKLTTVPFFFYNDTYAGREYVKLLSIMPKKVENFLLCDATRSMFTGKSIDSTSVKHLKIIEEHSNNTDITTLDDTIEPCPSLDCLEIECITGERSGLSLTLQPLDNKEEKEDVEPRQNARDLIGSFVMQNDESANYIMGKFPKLKRLIFENNIFNSEVLGTVLSPEIMIDFLKYSTEISGSVKANNIYAEGAWNYVIPTFLQSNKFQG